MKRFDMHIFICENKRPEGHPRGCCMDKGSPEIREKMKSRIKELGLNSSVRVNSSGCLDACEFGPSMVIYPEQVWYGGVSADDIEEIIKNHIIGGKPVERLQIKDKRFNKDDN